MYYVIFGMGEAAPYHGGCPSGVECQYFVFWTNNSLENVFPPGDLWFGSDVEHGIFTDYSAWVLSVHSVRARIAVKILRCVHFIHYAFIQHFLLLIVR